MFKFPQSKLRDKPNGFTLIEILVAISITAFLMIALYGVYATSHRSYRQSQNKAELNQNARIALERISRDIRQAERIVTELPLDDSDILNPPRHEIEFQDGHNDDRIQYIKYYLDGTNLQKRSIHYDFSNDPNADPSTWVAWNTEDEYGNLPNMHEGDPITKADKISNLEFYGEKLINIEVEVANSNDSFIYRTQTLGRNLL